MPAFPYAERRSARSAFITVRGLRYHLLHWGDAALATPEQPLLVMAHGWMDVAASFQFVVDALSGNRPVVAFDWRGFGESAPAGGDSYWFPDYLGDLDALLDALWPEHPVDLLGHSMGGNVAMLYAGVRPARVRRLINLEGYGMPEVSPAVAPNRYRRWLDELKAPMELRPYTSLAEVAGRLRKTNPRLPQDKALWLAQHWAETVTDDAGAPQWRLRADPAHKRANPVLPRKAEAMACWARITAPMLWVEGDLSDAERAWGGRYTRTEFHERLGVVPKVETRVLSPAGHMLHHDQPKALAEAIEGFLD